MKPTFHEYLRHIESYSPDQTAFCMIRDDETVSVSYTAFVADVKRFASRLTAEYPDIQSRHIGLLAKNSYAYIVALFGIWCAGSVAVPLNTDETKEALSEQIVFADVDCLFSEKEFLLEAFGSVSPFSCPVKWLSGYTDGWKDETIPTEKPMDEPILMLFTSGTTSKSKCVLHSQKTLLANMCPYLPQSGVCTILFINPLFHMIGIAGLIGWLYSGCRMILNTSFKYFFRHLSMLPCEQVFAVPAVMEYIRKNVVKHGRKNVGHLAVLFTGGAPVKVDTVQDFFNHGIYIYQNYSLSEAAGRGATTLMTNSPKNPSVGQADEGTEISIQDGEICLKSDNVMLGYYNDPEATAEAIQDGWLHTGDMGYLDEDGYLYITGRKKNLIILASGENISPERIEALLNKNDRILEVVVKEKENQVCAEIYCEESDQPAIRKWVDEVNRGLAYYQHVTLIEFRSTPFEKTASGKIKRASVRLR